MAAKARIVYNFDTWLGANVSRSSEVSGGDDNNVLDPRPGKKWIASGDNSEWLRFDLFAAYTINCLYINAHNLTANATVYLQANTGDSWSSPAQSQQLTIATDSDGTALPNLCYFPNWSAYRYWRLTFADSANPEGKIKIGNVFAGQYYELSRNFSDGARITWFDPSQVTQIGGTVEKVKKENIATRYRQARVDFSFVSETETLKWETIFRTVGNHSPLVLALDPDNYPTQKSMYCYLITDMDIAWQLADQYDVLTLVFEEKTR